MAREKGYAPTKGPKVIVPEEVKAVVEGLRGDPKQPARVKKYKVMQGHKGYKNFVSWS